MQKTTDELLLIRLRKEDNTSFELLYRWYFPAIAGYVTNHSGSNDDAEDIFQEAIIVLLQKVRQPDFALTASLKSYLFAVAKNLWLKRLRDNRLVPVEDIVRYQREGNTDEVSGGFTKGRQRWRCKGCDKRYSVERRSIDYPKQMRRQALEL